MPHPFQVVATPIGNLGDLSARATSTLRDADVVFCEDTRRTGTLMAHLGAKAKLVSCHQHNELQRIDVAKARIDAGDKVCYVSDAGAPGVSDPGSRLTDALVQSGYVIEVLPGPSAITAALMGAGLKCHPFVFLGFLPRKSAGRKSAAEQLLRSGFAAVLFEAPNRTDELLADLAEVLGPRRVVVGRELSKHHETFHRGVLGGALSPPLVEKGEVVIVIEAGDPVAAMPDAAPHEVAQLLLLDDALTPKARAKTLAQRTGMSTKDAYDYLSRLRHDGEPKG